MTAAALSGSILVPLFGVLLCLGPWATRPTVQFGVRIPPSHTADAVVRRTRRGYECRSALVALCATAVVIGLDARRSGLPSRIILIAEFAADLGYYWWAHQRIARVTSTEGWFVGQRQTVVADTRWRTEPQRFPVRWLIPAVAVIVATVTIGILRYPQLPPYLSNRGHRIATTPVRAFAVVIAQVYVTGIWAALLALAHRSRPDLDTADPGASLSTYRRALVACRL